MIPVLALVCFIVAAVLCGLGYRHPTTPAGLALGWAGLALLTTIQVPGLH